MADKKISELPVAEALGDGALFPAEQDGASCSVSGRLLKDAVKADVIEAVPSGNLFNKETVEPGLVFPQDGSMIAGSRYLSSDFIPVEEGKQYSWISPFGDYGENSGKMLAVYDTDKSYIGYLDGTYTGQTANGTSNTAICTVTINSSFSQVKGIIAYVRFGLRTDTADIAMFVEGDTYPTDYVPYGEVSKLKGSIGLQKSQVLPFCPLWGKKLSCNGDSICNASFAGGGYVSIIGEMYSMSTQNVGVSGGTITAETYNDDGTPRHWISRTIEEMDADADYAILEGGVNDSSLAIALGSITDGYEETLDDTTYCGAFESMLRQLLLRFPGKKVGYIAVHKMSTNYDSSNDEATSYYWAARRCCEKWGVPFLDLNTTVPPFGLIRNVTATADLYAALREAYTYNGDGWHPNEAGYRTYYVPKIVTWLEGL